jgi:hypothetical protein
MAGSLIVLFFIPFINISNIRSSTFRPIFKIFYWLLVSDFIILGWVGQKPVKESFVLIGQIATLFYFFFCIPFIGSLETKLIKNFKFIYKIMILLKLILVIKTYIQIKVCILFLFLLFLMCFIRHLPILLLKGKIFVYFNINKIVGILLFTPCFLNIGANIYYFVGFFIQQNIYFIWDSTGFCLNPVPNIGLSPAGNAEDTLTNVFLEPNFRNNINENPDGRGLNNRAESGLPRIRHRYHTELIEAAQQPIPRIQASPLYYAALPVFPEPEILARNNNGVLNLNRIGGEPILNNTPFGGMLLQEYFNCLEANNIPLQEAPRYLPQYMEQAYNNLITSEYYPLRSIVREEIRWSVFGSIRLQYVLNNQLQYFPSFDYNPADFDYRNARRRS